MFSSHFIFMIIVMTMIFITVLCYWLICEEIREDIQYLRVYDVDCSSVNVFGGNDVSDGWCYYDADEIDGLCGFTFII